MHLSVSGEIAGVPCDAGGASSERIASTLNLTTSPLTTSPSTNRLAGRNPEGLGVKGNGALSRRTVFRGLSTRLLRPVAAMDAA